MGTHAVPTPPKQVVAAESVERLLDRLFQRHAAQMVATLTRYLGFKNLQLAEDCVQEALVRALHVWPYKGVPERPEAWLLKVARHRALDDLRRLGRWNQKAEMLKREIPQLEEASSPAFAEELRDDQLAMVFACCDPALPAESRLALTLKVVCSFSVQEIARGLLLRDKAVAQRIVRAKKRLRERGSSFEVPKGKELSGRLSSVLRVIYLLFNEGYSANSGEGLLRRGLSTEALRLADLLASHPRTALPETYALVALLNFQASRFHTRVDGEGDLLLIEQQDRSLWDRKLIAKGVRALVCSAKGDRLTSYHLEAEISSCHVLAKDFASTDWKFMLDGYDRLLELGASPVVKVNRLIPLARVIGNRGALQAASELLRDPRLATYYPAWVVHAELLWADGQRELAAENFQVALRHCANEAVRRHLIERLTACSESMV